MQVNLVGGKYGAKALFLFSLKGEYMRVNKNILLYSTPKSP